ncbi:MAG TPA: SurA N-terminal domain-containing protein [Geobacteraceae bacterium]|mgnify:CR=1 FL=1|nr:SurA N-terminal domain-containing protein [Geobacteraceae bacterium]
MLGIMRKYKQSIIIKGVFSIIVLSFVGTIFLIWGEGGEGFKDSGYALKINGTKISQKEYLQNYEKAKAYLQQIYGQPITPELEKIFSVKKLTMESLINSELTQQEARRKGIKVSDEELAAEISKMPMFQKNGVFDNKTYLQMLKMNRYTPSAFEEAQRRDLIARKLRKTITDPVKVSDQEALLAYKKQHDKINLQYVSFSPAEFRSKVKVTDKDLSAYLQNHQKEFRTKERISISYLVFSPSMVESQVTVTEEELQNFYQKNIDRYQGKKGILPFEEVKDQAKKDFIKFMAGKLAYEKVAVALSKNSKTSDLKETARMLGVKVVDTPMFAQDAPPPSLADEAALVKKVFSQKEGEIAGPYETTKGIYLLKIKSRAPSIVPPLSEVKEEVEKQFIDENSFTLAKEKASEVQAGLAKKSFGTSVRETGFFQYSDKGEIPRIGTSKELMEAVVLLSKTNPAPPSPVFVNGHWYAVRLKDKIESSVSDFQKEREKIIQSLLPAKQQKALEKWLQGLKDKAKIVINPALTTD